MPVALREYNQACVLLVHGELAADNAVELRQSAETRIQASQYPDLIVDLQDCPYINSTGLEALLAVKRRCERQSGTLRLVGLNASCRNVLRITRLQSLFILENDLPAALAHLQ
jgi:anti-sigma B factor antagonist